MTDLSTILASSARRIWSPQRAIAFASAIADRLPDSIVDWDDGAGEDWAGVLQGPSLLGFVSVRSAIAFLRQEAIDVLPREIAADVELLAIDDFDAPRFSATLSSIEAFARRPVSGHLDATTFSISDLVWATI